MCQTHYVRQWYKSKPSYKAWQEAKARTTNTNRADYHRYGGRGITMCVRWKDSYANFHADMGDKPSPEHSLDRIDVNGDYTPENCRWTTRSIQNINRRQMGNNTSGYRGVSYIPKEGNWVAQIKIEKTAIIIGRFKDPELAALAYDAAAIQLHGAEAHTNIL